MDFKEIEKKCIAKGYGSEVKWLDAIHHAGSPPWDGSSEKAPKGWLPPVEDVGYDEIDLEARPDDIGPRGNFVWLWRDGKLMRKC